MDKYKILGMIAAAELQLDELRFDPREFLEKLKQEMRNDVVFEYPAVTLGAPQVQLLTC
jgi:hypothetical protein